jgi:hypothetical protein
MQKVLIALTVACASSAKFGVAPRALRVRGGAQLGSIDEKAMLLIQAAGCASFGAEFALSDWASTRYWDNAKPTTAWKQLSDAFAIGLLTQAAQTYKIATEGAAGAITSYGKTFTYGWVAWTLMHVKWHQEGTLIGSGKYKGQVGGGAACAAIAALSVYTFFM